jgi:hypothetical protein
VCLREPGEVAEHPPAEVGSGRGLVLDVDQEEGVPAAESGFDDHIRLMFVADSDIGEDFFVQELETVRRDIFMDLG